LSPEEIELREVVRIIIYLFKVFFVFNQSEPLLPTDQETPHPSGQNNAEIDESEKDLI
jgi:hypothetical protein